MNLVVLNQYATVIDVPRSVEGMPLYIEKMEIWSGVTDASCLERLVAKYLSETICKLCKQLI